jgi:hypothetical protein
MKFVDELKGLERQEAHSCGDSYPLHSHELGGHRFFNFQTKLNCFLHSFHEHVARPGLSVAASQCRYGCHKIAVLVLFMTTLRSLVVCDPPYPHETTTDRGDRPLSTANNSATRSRLLQRLGASNRWTSLFFQPSLFVSRQEISNSMSLMNGSSRNEEGCILLPSRFFQTPPSLRHTRDTPMNPADPRKLSQALHLFLDRL